MDLFTLFQNYGNSGMIPVTMMDLSFSHSTDCPSVSPTLDTTPICSKLWYFAFSMCSVVCFAPLSMYHLWPSTPVLYINPAFSSIYYLRLNDLSFLMLLFT